MKWSMHYIIPLILAFYVPVYMVCATDVEQCGQTYLSPSGLTCLYCAPGTYKVLDCTTNLTSASCKTCPMNTYQRNCNRAESCEPCNPRCKAAYTTKAKDCTLYEDTVCECEEGRFWHPETSTDGVCLRHNPCDVGYGMVNLGNQHHDTECQKCIPGRTFSISVGFDKCNICTKCERYRMLCNTTRDAECEVAWMNKSISTKPTQKKMPDDGLLAVIVVLSVVVFILLAVIAWMIRRRLKRFCSPCSSEEDGTGDKDDPPQDSHNENEDGITGGRPQPQNIPDQNVGGSTTTAPTNGPQDSHNENEDGVTGDALQPQNIPEDQNVGGSTTTAPTNGDPQHVERAIGTDEHDVAPGQSTVQPRAPIGEDNAVSLSGPKKSKDPTEANVTAAFRRTNQWKKVHKTLDARNELKNTQQNNSDEECASNVSSAEFLDTLGKNPDEISVEDENSNLIATEVDEGSTSKTCPVEGKHGKQLISQPTESEVHPLQCSSLKFNSVHQKTPDGASDHVKMDTLKLSYFTEPGSEEPCQSNSLEDSSISTCQNHGLMEYCERGDRNTTSDV